jgi:hypothetical protein
VITTKPRGAGDDAFGTLSKKILLSASAIAGVGLVRSRTGFASILEDDKQAEPKPDYTLTIATKPIELASKPIVSVTTFCV